MIYPIHTHVVKGTHTKWIDNVLESTRSEITVEPTLKNTLIEAFSLVRYDPLALFIYFFVRKIFESLITIFSGNRMYLDPNFEISLMAFQG